MWVKAVPPPLAQGSLGVQGLPPPEVSTKRAAFPSSMSFPGNALPHPFLTPHGAGSAGDPRSGCGWNPAPAKREQRQCVATLPAGAEQLDLVLREAVLVGQCQAQHLATSQR